MTSDQLRIRELEERVKQLEAELYEKESVTTCRDGTKYPVRDHPRWSNQEGNPYLPLDINGKMQKGYIG